MPNEQVLNTTSKIYYRSLGGGVSRLHGKSRHFSANYGRRMIEVVDLCKPRTICIWTISLSPFIHILLSFYPRDVDSINCTFSVCADALQVVATPRTLATSASFDGLPSLATWSWKAFPSLILPELSTLYSKFKNYGESYLIFITFSLQTRGWTAT